MLDPWKMRGRALAFGFGLLPADLLVRLGLIKLGLDLGDVGVELRLPEEQLVGVELLGRGAEPLAPEPGQFELELLNVDGLCLELRRLALNRLPVGGGLLFVGAKRFKERDGQRMQFCIGFG